MKNKLTIVILSTICLCNYSCKEQDLQPEKLDIRHKKLSTLANEENEAQAYLNLINSDNDIVYQWDHKKFIAPPNASISGFTPEYLLIMGHLIRRNKSLTIDFKIKINDEEAWERFKTKSADYAEAADYFRMMPEIPEPKVVFGTPDNTHIGYEIESKDTFDADGIYEGTRRVSWYCYRCIKGSESIAFKSYDRIKYNYRVSDFLLGSFYSKKYTFSSMEHLNILAEGSIEGQLSTPMLAYYDDLTTPHLAKLSVTFKDKRELSRVDGSTRTVISPDIQSTKAWTKNDIDLKDIE